MESKQLIHLLRNSNATQLQNNIFRFSDGRAIQVLEDKVIVQDHRRRLTVHSLDFVRVKEKFIYVSRKPFDVSPKLITIKVAAEVTC